MKHVTYGEKSLLVGDEAADLLLEYAAALAKNQSADTVTLHAFSQDGQEVDASFLLDQGTSVMAETSHTSLPDPDNGEAVDYMGQALSVLTGRPVQPEERIDPNDFEHEFGL